MALNLEQTRNTHKQRTERLNSLIKSRARILAEDAMKVQYKSLSHLSKDLQEIMLKEAEITFMDRMIAWLTQQK